MHLTRSSRSIALLALIALLGVTGWYFLVPNGGPHPDGTVTPDSNSPPAPDPRETFATPFRNVRPGIKYTGDAACADCHHEIDHSYHQHPMGRSAALIGPNDTNEKFDAAANNPASSQGFQLRVEPEQGFRHVMTLLGSPTVPSYTTVPVLAVGSGARGRSYLSVESGAVWQSPISWFSQTGGKWDVSPGFQLPAGTRREIDAKCLFCHVNQVDPVPQSINRYREPLVTEQAAIGCERCHGPGELHVTERSKAVPVEMPDYSIVNPSHLPADLKMAVCQQCHLQGVNSVLQPDRTWFDFRPGMPLELFFNVFVRQPVGADLRRSVGQFEQMAASKCFTGSPDKMDCTTCHDPHAKPKSENVAAFFDKKCLKCHTVSSCAAPRPERVATGDNCVRCHMPKAPSTNITHTAVTDHTIPRNPTANKKLADRVARDVDTPIYPFALAPSRLSAAELNRNLAVALSRVAYDPPPLMDFNFTVVWKEAETRLIEARRQSPSDPVLYHETAMLKMAAVTVKRADRLAAVQSLAVAVSMRPDSEIFLASLADHAAMAGDFTTAIDALNRLISLSPSSARLRLARGYCLMQKPDWAAAEADYRAALAIQPIDPVAWDFLAKCCEMQGNEQGTRAALETSKAIKAKLR